MLPTYAQMRDPALIPGAVKKELAGIGLWDVHPRNLFRINWHNQPVERGGGFGGVNFVELPTAITGTKARIVGIAGKWFPTGAQCPAGAGGAEETRCQGRRMGAGRQSACF